MAPAHDLRTASASTGRFAWTIAALVFALTLALGALLWLVPDRRIVRDDLPTEWGLLALDDTGRLRVARRAPKLRPEPIPATFRAALLRATAKTATRRAT